MSRKLWKAGNELDGLLLEIKNCYHQPRLDRARFAISFEDSKAYVNDRLNLGKVRKFYSFDKIWHGDMQYDFSLILCMDVWQDLLDQNQRKAMLDLHLCRCDVEYVPEYEVVGGRRRIAKDEYGRVKLTDEVKLDDDGRPKWKVMPLDIVTFMSNIRRFGLWYESLAEFSDVVAEATQETT